MQVRSFCFRLSRMFPWKRFQPFYSNMIARFVLDFNRCSPLLLKVLHIPQFSREGFGNIPGSREALIQSARAFSIFLRFPRKIFAAAPVGFRYFLYSIRMELRTHSMATPESANTASHMEA